MIVFLDAYYPDDESAVVASITIENWETEKVLSKQVIHCTRGLEHYESGAFYKRELPLLLDALGNIPPDVTTIVVDGYVDTDHAGLGRHLYDHFSGDYVIIGVAKNPYVGAAPELVYRGGSTKPLYVTSAGMPQEDAAKLVRDMQGHYRKPTLLTVLDRMTKDNHTCNCERRYLCCDE